MRGEIRASADSTAWRIGLSGISAQYESRNILRLTDKVIRAAIKAAYKLDRAFGLFVEVAAVTGARIGQIAKLLVADLRIDEGPPRLMMPSSQKGSRRDKIKKAAKQPVPIPMSLAVKLQSDRPADAPLLLRADGLAWQSTSHNDHQELYAEAAKLAGVKGSITQLRHTHIIRLQDCCAPSRVGVEHRDGSGSHACAHENPRAR